jgi:hypothetical protein
MADRADRNDSAASATGAEPVGPVLESGPLADALIHAISQANREVRVEDRGSYKRVAVAGRCRLMRALVEEILGRDFLLPRDLEAVMPSFKGTFTVSEDEAVWSDGEQVE